MLKFTRHARPARSLCSEVSLGISSRACNKYQSWCCRNQESSCFFLSPTRHIRLGFRLRKSKAIVRVESNLSNFFDTEEWQSVVHLPITTAPRWHFATAFHPRIVLTEQWNRGPSGIKIGRSTYRVRPCCAPKTWWILMFFS